VADSVAEITSKARLTRTIRARPVANISGVTITALDIASMADSGLIMPPTAALVLFLEVFCTGYVDRCEPSRGRKDADGGQGHSRDPKASEAENKLVAPPTTRVSLF